MPNRIIQESICTSETLNDLSDFEERFWHRLTVCVDDYGRFDARPAILKSRLFPLRIGTTDKNIQDALKKISSVGLVDLYEVGGKPFLQLVTWAKYQRIRNKRSKYPAPEDGDPLTFDSKSQQVAAECPRNPIQSESNPNPNPNPSYCAAPETAATPPFIVFPCNGAQKEREIPEDAVEEWAKLYPAVDVRQELRNMLGWLNANPTKRKTYRGVLKFINGWLAREQDKGGTQCGAPKPNGAFGGIELNVNRL